MKTKIPEYPVNHEDFDDIKKNLLEKEGDVNHASFDGVEKKSHVCHHQKGGDVPSFSSIF